uniref:Clathrin light chain n=1 Tax=Neolamprologus brichardi TaxID=32507 RepID=A0A3Q4G9U0_NEOBR
MIPDWKNVLFPPWSLCVWSRLLLSTNANDSKVAAAEEAMISDLDENNPGTEWERVARLCDFNPKSSKQAKDVSRMRSVLISLKQSPLVR